MSLKDALEAQALLKRGSKCSVSLLPADIRADLEQWLAVGAQGSKLSRGLKSEYDVNVSAGVIQRHRRGDCDCAS